MSTDNPVSQQPGADLTPAIEAATAAVRAHPSTTFMAPCEDLARVAIEAAAPILLAAQAAAIAELGRQRDEALAALRRRSAQLDKATRRREELLDREDALTRKCPICQEPAGRQCASVGGIRQAPHMARMPAPTHTAGQHAGQVGQGGETP